MSQTRNRQEDNTVRVMESYPYQLAPKRARAWSTKSFVIRAVLLVALPLLLAVVAPVLFPVPLLSMWAMMMWCIHRNREQELHDHIKWMGLDPDKWHDRRYNG